MDANCKYCGGTGKIQLLLKEVPCDCVTDPAGVLFTQQMIDKMHAHLTPGVPYVTPTARLSAPLLYIPQWDVFKKHQCRPQQANPSTMDVWLWGDQNGTLRWIEAPDNLNGVLVMRDFNVELIYDFPKLELNLMCCFLSSDKLRKAHLMAVAEKWVDALTCSPDDVDFQTLFDELVLIP